MRTNLHSSPIINAVFAWHRAGHTSGAIRTKDEFGDFQLHIIFETPRWEKVGPSGCPDHSEPLKWFFRLCPSISFRRYQA